MNQNLCSDTVKITIGAIYLIALFAGLYFLFSLIDIKDLSSYEFIRENKNIILLDQVTAKINLRDKPEISIKADHAEYDYDNLNTKFFDNVKIKYSSNIITSDNLDLIFNKNIANMYNNVFFKNDTSNAKADLINMNFLTGNINIKMYEESNKIEINKK